MTKKHRPSHHGNTLSSGGQGTVFKAEAIVGGSGASKEIVALKVYYPNQMEQRTAREVEALRKLGCRSIVKLHASGPTEMRGQRCRFVATAYIDGEVLSECVAKGPMPSPQVAAIGREISVAITELWSLRIVHRDIKPSNILIRKDSQPILIDLGVARHLAQATLTTAGRTWGTVGYMAPEHMQARRQLTCKADMFPLGITLQECLQGRHPTLGNQLILQNGGPKTQSIAPKTDIKLAEFIDLMVHQSTFARPTPQEATAYFAQW